MTPDPLKMKHTPMIELALRATDPSAIGTRRRLSEDLTPGERFTTILSLSVAGWTVLYFVAQIVRVM